MNYTITTQADKATVTMNGRFTFSDYPSITTLKSELARLPVRFIDVDFHAIEFIDSSAIGMLMHLQEDAKNRQQAFAIRHASSNPQVDRALDIARVKAALNVAG